MKRSEIFAILGGFGLLVSFPSCGDTTPLGNPTRVYGKGQQHQVVTPEDSEHMAGRRTTDVSGVYYLEDARRELIELGGKIPGLKRRLNQLKGARPGTPRYALHQETQRELEGAQTRIRVLNGMIKNLKPRPKTSETAGATTPAQPAPETPISTESPAAPEDPVETASKTVAKAEQHFSEGRIAEPVEPARTGGGADRLPWVVAILALVVAIGSLGGLIVYVKRQRPTSN